MLGGDLGEYMSKGYAGTSIQRWTTLNPVVRVRKAVVWLVTEMLHRT